MDRKLISRRIGSILDDISRLSNALYAMDTTDIQRYPDNYETLSTDAALRAERIACRLRHLIYSSTTIRKGDYLKSASVMHGITITYENEVLAVTLPSLLPKRRQRQSAEFLLDPLYFCLLYTSPPRWGSQIWRRPARSGQPPGRWWRKGNST